MGVEKNSEGGKQELKDSPLEKKEKAHRAKKKRGEVGTKFGPLTSKGVDRPCREKTSLGDKGVQ